MHSFEVHSNESACRNSGRFGLDQVSYIKQIIRKQPKGNILKGNILYKNRLHGNSLYEINLYEKAYTKITAKMKTVCMKIHQLM